MVLLLRIDVSACVLACYFERDRRVDAGMLEGWATDILGMVAAEGFVERDDPAF